MQFFFNGESVNAAGNGTSSQQRHKQRPLGIALAVAVGKNLPTLSKTAVPTGCRTPAHVLKSSENTDNDISAALQLQLSESMLLNIKLLVDSQ